MRDIRITTLSTTRDLDDDDRCEVGRACVGVHSVADRPGRYYVILTEVTDPDELAAFATHMGPGEILGTTPCSVIDRVGGGGDL